MAPLPHASRSRLASATLSKSALPADRAAPQYAPLLRSSSPAFQRALARLERFARHDGTTVLLVGESGTGKSVFAEHLHACSPRNGRVFHRVTLSAITDTLAPSELFGHLQGSFTDARSNRAGHFVSAQGGTLFLDEIGKASATVQHQLLDAVERREIAPVGADRSVRVDVRIVAATNVPLDRLVAHGTFLPDLHARLDGFAVHIPPLRERREDIPELVRYFVDVHARHFGYERPPAIDDDLMSALSRAPWPNNVRELDVMVQRLLVDGEGTSRLTLDSCDVSLTFRDAAEQQLDRNAAIRRAFATEKSVNVSALARRLGCSRTTIYQERDRMPAREAREE